MFVFYVLQAGIPGLGERRRKKLGPRQLQQLNLSQTQVLYNDLQTQIESKNWFLYSCATLVLHAHVIIVTAVVMDTVYIIQVMLS